MKLSMKKVQSPLGCHKKGHKLLIKTVAANSSTVSTVVSATKTCAKAHNPKVRVDVKLHEKKQSPYIHMHIQCKRHLCRRRLALEDLSEFDMQLI